MTHLYIEQNTGLIEEVSSSIISKLYELAISGDLDEFSDLKGRLHSINAYDNQVTYLTTTFENLHISVDTPYIYFSDPEVLRVISKYWGDGDGVTESQMNSHTSLGFSGTNDIGTNRIPFINNTNVQTFNELGRFTSIKTINGQVFENATNLESIDLSNIEYLGWQTFLCTNLTGTINLPSIKKIGTGTGSQSCSTFKGCKNITNVICGPNLELIGVYAFINCTNLQTVTGLSNVSTICDGIFSGCTSLTSVDLNSNKELPVGMFENCSSLQTIGTWVNNTVYVDFATFSNCENLEFPEELTVYFKKHTRVVNGVTELNKSDNFRSFKNCKKLKKVILQGTEIQLGRSTFEGCTSLTEIVNSDKIIWIGLRCFSGCPISGTLDLSGCIGTSGRNNGSDTPSNYQIIDNMPNITKVIFGGWGDDFNGDWALFATDRSFFYNCPNLTTVDFGIINTTFPNYRGDKNSTLFGNCPNMTTLIIRNTSVLELKNTSGTVDPKDIGGVNVTLYVPDNIVNDYKSASGWSNISNQIKGISELPS